jgi:hypothetical protein
LNFSLRRTARVFLCAGVFALGVGGALLVTTDAALTQVPTDPTLPEPPPVPTLPTVPDPDPEPPPPPEPPPNPPPAPPAPPPPPSTSGSPGPSGNDSGPAASSSPKKKAVKPKVKKKKKKKAQAKPAAAAPVTPPSDPPFTGGATGGELEVTPAVSDSNGPVFALPLRILALITMALGGAVLLVLAATPVRNLAGVSIRLAQRRGEVGLVTVCIMLASLVGFVLSLMGG